MINVISVGYPIALFETGQAGHGTSSVVRMEHNEWQVSGCDGSPLKGDKRGRKLPFRMNSLHAELVM
jgi:hypothetical protein